MIDLEPLLIELSRGGVEFIIVGGVAATILGSARSAGAPTPSAEGSTSRSRPAWGISISSGGGYPELLPHTEAVTLFGHAYRSLGLAKLIQVKRAAGRPKDLEAIAELEALREERDRNTGAPDPP